MSTSHGEDQPTPSNSKPLQTQAFGSGGFFNSSNPLIHRSNKWPSTRESAELRLLLLQPNPNPAFVYDAYLRLVNNPLHPLLPRAMHQLVLRKVVPPVSSIPLPNFSKRPNALALRLETRLREVIFHMRAAGIEPTKGDYHFILEHMATLGHQRAAYNVYLELIKVGHKPSERTIALALLAVVRRHKMRIYDDHLGAVLHETRGIGSRLIDDLVAMQRDKTKRFSPMCLDLACRVFKITGSIDKFLALLKTGYGIDVFQPDHRPLEFVERMQAKLAAIGSPSELSMPKFTTHTLNTTLDMLGKSGYVREMVSTFECLTNPLPARARADSYQYDLWEDDEPENASRTSLRTPNRLSEYVPSAVPNTTSLAFMIKHTVDSFKFDLCKHYLLLAIHLDRQSDTHLREQLRTALRVRRAYAAAAELESRSNLPVLYTLPEGYADPPIGTPRVQVSREMFTKVWGLANQKAHMRTLRGLVRTVRRLIRRKQKDIAAYKAVLEHIPTVGLLPSLKPDVVGREEREEIPSEELQSWIGHTIEEQPQGRRQFSLVEHVGLLEAEVEKFEDFMQHGIRGVWHSSSRIEAEMERKRERVRLRAIQAAEQTQHDRARRQKKAEERAEAGEAGGGLAPT